MKELSRNQKGSALVSVIVVIAFISILATTLLYVSTVNFQMKMDDNKIKVSFYDAEEPIDMIRANLVKMVSETEAGLYTEMMSSMGARAGSGDVQLTYENRLFEELEKKINVYLPSLSGVSELDLSGITKGVNPTDGTYEIKNIQVKKKNSNGYTSVITTDIVVQAPDRVWAYDPAAKSDNGDPAEKEVDYFKCVYYSNWVKK